MNGRPGQSVATAGAATGSGGEPDTRRILAGPLSAGTPHRRLHAADRRRGARLLPGANEAVHGGRLAALSRPRLRPADLRVVGRAAPDPTREAATNITLVSLEAVADRTAADLGGGLTGDEVSSKVSVESEGQADVASIKATDPDPRFAATLANAFAQNYIASGGMPTAGRFSRRAHWSRPTSTGSPPAAQQSSEGQSLQRQIGRLSTLEALQTGNAELVQRATRPHLALFPEDRPEHDPGVDPGPAPGGRPGSCCSSASTAGCANRRSSRRPSACRC